MNLADQIIEHGPYVVDEIAYVTGSTAEFNALRDELIELRKLRAAAARADYDQCGCLGGILGEWSVMSQAELDELVQRADEHTEDCR